MGCEEIHERDGYDGGYFDFDSKLVGFILSKYGMEQKSTASVFGPNQY